MGKKIITIGKEQEIKALARQCAIHTVNDQVCSCCNGTGIIEGEFNDDLYPCRTCNGSGKLGD